MIAELMKLTFKKYTTFYIKITNTLYMQTHIHTKQYNLPPNISTTPHTTTKYEIIVYFYCTFFRFLILQKLIYMHNYKLKVKQIYYVVYSLYMTYNNI